MKFTRDGIFNVVIDADAEWHHSTFPHPLITIDYDARDRPIQVLAVGPVADRLSATLDAVVAEVSA